MRNLSNIAIFIVILGLTFFGQVGAVGQETGKPDEKDDEVSMPFLLGKLDLVVPENSLFTLINATPGAVIRPKDGDQFAASVLPAITDAFGQEQYAVGIEVNLGLNALPKKYSAREVRIASGEEDDEKRSEESKERVEQLKRARWLSNFTVTGAAIQETESGAKTTYGLGLNYNYDTGSAFNAQRKFATCLASFEVELRELINRRIKIIDKYNGNQEEVDNDEEFKSLKRRRNKIYEDCVGKIESWNRNIYGAGLAVYQTSVSADPATPNSAQNMETAARDMDETGWGVWASSAIKAGDSGQFVLGGKWTENAVRQRTQGDKKITETVDAWQVGARYIRGALEEKAPDGSVRRSVRGFAEIAYVDEKFGEIDDEFTQVGIGFEVQVQKNVFFQLTVGDTFGSQIDRGASLSGQVKWAFSNAPAS